MLKKISNLKLLGILAALILVYFASNHFSKGNRSESFRTALVSIDTSQVSRILITSPGENVELSKSDTDWILKLSNNKEVAALDNQVNNTLSSLMSVKPGRMVTKDQAKWKDYQVDSAGTRVQIFEGEKNTLDMVVGRFGMEGQRQFYSFVRLSEDAEVYTADNFMGLSGGNQSSSYRDQTILKLEPDSITSIQFAYPSDTSFQLIRQDSLWLVNQSQIADSAAMASYLVGLRNVTSDQFADDIDLTGMDRPLFEMNIDSRTAESFTIEAFSLPGQLNMVCHSSLNPSVYFQDTALLGKFFKGFEHFASRVD